MAINGGGIQGSGSSVMGLMQMIQGLTGGGQQKSKPVDAPKADDSAISRRMDSASQDPQVLLHQGIQHADNPDVPLDYETRLAVMQPLLEAKHFGPGGQAGQGQIQGGKMGGGNASGIIGTVAALA